MTVDNGQFAQAGIDVITSNTNGTWIGFFPVGGSATVSATANGQGDNISALTIAEGVFIPGTWVNITPSAGTVIAVRKGA